MELDDSIRQSTNDLGHFLSDLVPPPLINHTHTYTQMYEAVYKQEQGAESALSLILLLKQCVC